MHATSPRHHLPDQRDAVGQRTRRHLDQLEPEVAVHLLVETLEDERVRKADLTGSRGLHEALITNEEDHRLVGPLGDHPPDLLSLVTSAP
jgi:hypothetical protein